MSGHCSSRRYTNQPDKDGRTVFVFDSLPDDTSDARGIVVEYSTCNKDENECKFGDALLIPQGRYSYCFAEELVGEWLMSIRI